MGKKRGSAFTMSINLISSVGVLIINICVSFFLTPYIIETIGVEANGFVNLANNFVSYADLVVIALNAMAARFITIAYVNKDYEKANLYYNSVFWGNLLIVGVLIIPATVFIAVAERIIDIPVDLVFDVKILFILAFAGFFIRTGLPNWDCGTYVSNRLDRSNLPNMVLALLKCAIMIVLFILFVPRVWFVSIALTTVTVLTLAVGAYNTHTLTPELKIHFGKPVCSKDAIKELVGSGIWSTIAIAGNTLITGIDLLVCNIFLGATLMGIMSISKSLFNILVTYTETIRGTFGPQLTIAYAKGDKDEIAKVITQSMKISAVIVSIPVAGILVMSGELFELWIPSQDAHLLQILTSLTIVRYVFSSGITPINNVFMTVNRVRLNSISLLVTGAASILVLLVLLKYTGLGLFAVAGVSSIMNLLRDLFFMVPVGSVLLGFRWNAFYGSILRSIVSIGLITGTGYLIKSLFTISSWGMFFFVCCLIAAMGVMINAFIVLNKEDRVYFVNAIRRKLAREK